MQKSSGKRLFNTQETPNNHHLHQKRNSSSNTSSTANFRNLTQNKQTKVHKDISIISE